MPPFVPRHSKGAIREGSGVGKGESLSNARNTREKGQMDRGREGGSCNTSFHEFRAVAAAAAEEGVLCAHAAAVPPRKSSRSGTVAGAAAAAGGWAP